MHNKINKDNLKKVLNEIDREPENPVTLIGATKLKGVDLIQSAVKAGINNFGENYAQELAEKAELLEDSVCWHFIGPIQTNKLKTIAKYADWVQSVDRLKVAKILNKQCKDLNKEMQVLIQVNSDNELKKSGLSEEELVGCIDFIINDCPNLKLRGFMFMPKFTNSLDEKRKSLRKIQALIEIFSATYPNLDTFSFGTTHDYLVAIEHGSNMIRIGELLFGKR